MNIEHFPLFIKINFPEMSDVPNEELTEMGADFKKYLEEKFKGDMEKLEPIWDIEPIKAIINKDHPLKVNGYDPALVFHFTQHVQEEVAKIS